MRILGIDFGEARIGVAVSDHWELRLRPWRQSTGTGMEKPLERIRNWRKPIPVILVVVFLRI